MIKKLKSVFIIFLIYLVFPLSVLTQENTKPDLSAAFRVINTWLEAQRDYDILPGISAAIVCDQEIIWSKGYGMSDMPAS